MVKANNELLITQTRELLHKPVFGVLGWVFALYALCYSGVASSSYSGALAGAALACLFVKSYRMAPFDKTFVPNILSAWFSVNIVLSMSLISDGSVFTLFDNGLKILSALSASIGFFCTFRCALLLLFSFVDKVSMRNSKEQNKASVFMEFISTHRSVVYFVAILIGWLPYFVVFFPGSVPYDGYHHLAQFFGYRNISNHHPWLLTYVYGALVNIGHLLGNDNLGVFITVGLCALIELTCYSYLCKRVSVWLNSVKLGFVCVVFFALCPIFPAYAQCINKDGLFAALCALLFVLSVDIVRSNKLSKCKLIVVVAVCLLVCFTRNNGLLFVAPLLIVLLVLKWGVLRKSLLIACGIFAVGYLLFGTILPNALGVAPGGKQEALSIPFLQTARYVRDYDSEVTDSERKAIDAVLDYSTIGENYNPELSDSVKGTFKGKASNKALLRYFVNWAKMGLKHPDVYIDAFLQHSYGWVDPLYRYTGQAIYPFYIRGGYKTDAGLNIYYVFNDDVRSSFKGVVNFISDLPLLSLLINSGTYIWLLVSVGGYLASRRKWCQFALLVPWFLMVLVCIASPVNGFLRYAVPFAACAPVFISLSFMCVSSSEGRKRHHKALSTKTW